MDIGNTNVCDIFAFLCYGLFGTVLYSALWKIGCQTLRVLLLLEEGVKYILNFIMHFIVLEAISLIYFFISWKLLVPEIAVTIHIFMDQLVLHLDSLLHCVGSFLCPGLLQGFLFFLWSFQWQFTFSKTIHSQFGYLNYLCWWRILLVDYRFRLIICLSWWDQVWPCFLNGDICCCIHNLLCLLWCQCTWPMNS